MIIYACFVYIVVVLVVNIYIINLICTFYTITFEAHVFFGKIMALYIIFYSPAVAIIIKRGTYVTSKKYLSISG